MANNFDVLLDRFQFSKLIEIMTDLPPSTNQSFSDLHRFYLAQRGVKLNSNGGFYRRGKNYGIETKLRVAAAYVDAREKM